MAERGRTDTPASGASASGKSASTKSASPKSASPKSGSTSRTQALGERLTAASEEHRANANPASATAARKAAKGGRRGPRRARLRLTRLDPWSVMKTAFLLSIAVGVVTIVSVTIIWSVLGAAGVWDSINATVADVVGTEETSDFDVENYIGISRVLGFTMLVSAVDVVLLTAIATLMAFLYNMAAALLGGIELTLAEDDH